eukprot:6173943-Pleurochrysis_carterae.AAC.1
MDTGYAQKNDRKREATTLHYTQHGYRTIHKELLNRNRNNPPSESVDDLSCRAPPRRAVQTQQERGERAVLLQPSVATVARAAANAYSTADPFAA